jgi:hypothetical protein
MAAERHCKQTSLVRKTNYDLAAGGPKIETDVGVNNRSLVRGGAVVPGVSV